jgi:phosphoadenosine phosphosulfate reductase
VQTRSPEELLRWAIAEFGRDFAVVTSFQLEGMVVIDMAARLDAGVRVATLDTGRLPAETLSFVETVKSRYDIGVELIKPDPLEVARMIEMHGQDLFYSGVPQRRLCCEVRKVRPMARLLAGLRAYAVGLRRSQSESRAEVAQVADENGVLKLSPLAEWSKQQVLDYTRERDVPIHPLYAQGYASIGCAPCTRAIQPAEDERAGRWWWEIDAAKECGLHFSQDRRTERTVDVLLQEVLERVHA